MQLDSEFGEDKQEEDILAGFPEHEPLEITRVERQKKRDHRYTIHFGPHIMTVHEDVMIKYMMTTGSRFMKSDLESIVLADERQRAYVEGLRYLGLKPRTVLEMKRRLRQKEIGETIIEETLQRLQQEKYIDDPAYAMQWAEQRITNQRKGKMWIRQELREKGIDKSLITEALEQISPDQEKESALHLARKKWQLIRGEVPDKRRKTGAYLMRRGYSGEMVRQVLQILLQEENFQG
ncbi:regulatory protein RecX [Paenibacillus sp. sgz500958]|uniref:regulatory protein RecX n=1 Tax=Paenibacillus sp. sgz500958 TaxID=3242475 RepID=UPI0036D3A2E2